MLKTTPSHQSALSLIEILVAVTLISFVLIALASNIFYTQRVIIDARLRAKAVDQANSCLERWRTARDGMLWWQFYQRLKCHCAKGGDDYPHSEWADEIKCEFPYQLPAYDILNRPAGLYAEKPVLDFFTDTTVWNRQTRGNVNDTICGQPKPNITDNPNLKLGYHGQYQVRLKFENPADITKAQKVTVAVTVQYQDYKGNNKQVQVAQKFSQDITNELRYDGYCPTTSP